jgi:hypothetical protein
VRQLEVIFGKVGREYLVQMLGGLGCEFPGLRSETWGTRHCLPAVARSILNSLYIFDFLPSAAGGDHLGGVLEAGVGNFGAGEHSCDFVGAGAVVEDADLGFGAAVGLALFYG